MSSKVCNSCNEEKPTTEFWKNKRNKDGSGLCYRCIECSKKYNKEYYSKNRNKLIQQSTQYTKDNIESYREYKREWCANNKDNLYTYGRQYR